jgi:hypothetical protein
VYLIHNRFLVWLPKSVDGDEFGVALIRVCFQVLNRVFSVFSFKVYIFFVLCVKPNCSKHNTAQSFIECVICNLGVYAIFWPYLIIPHVIICALESCIVDFQYCKSCNVIFNLTLWPDNKSNYCVAVHTFYLVGYASP